jgi:hypothetical protein
MHDMNGSEIDVRLLVRWLGSEGAKAALTASRRCSVKVLRSIAEGLGCVLTKEMSRQQLITEIIEVASKRIDKPLEALYQMSREELIAYFTEKEVESKELLDLLKELDVQPHREGLRGLIEFTAQQISETGRFMRIAGSSAPEHAAEPNP